MEEKEVKFVEQGKATSRVDFGARSRSEAVESGGFTPPFSIAGVENDSLDLCLTSLSLFSLVSRR